VIKHATLLAFVVSVAVAPQVRAQQPKPPAPAAKDGAQPARTPLTPLKVQIVISKYQGEKKVSSLPYTLAVNANEIGRQAELTSGIQVMIPMVTVNEKTTGPVYKDVGTSIKCSATGLEEGRFKLDLAIEDASVYADAKIPSDGNRGPWIQTFRSNQSVILRDGQTTQYTTGTDKVSGEVVKIDVTLNVVK